MLGSAIAAVPPHSHSQPYTHFLPQKLFSHSNRQERKSTQDSNQLYLPIGIGNYRRNLKQTTIERRPRSTISSNSMCSSTYHQISLDFKAFFLNGHYNQAAEKALLAKNHAEQVGNLKVAEKFASAYELARRYQHLQCEMIQKNWQIGVEPIFEPDDPSSNEARCTMVCQPDRPIQSLEKPIDKNHIPSVKDSVEDEKIEKTTDNHHALISSKEQNINNTCSETQPRSLTKPPLDHETNYNICCFNLSWFGLSKRKVNG